MESAVTTRRTLQRATGLLSIADVARVDGDRPLTRAEHAVLDAEIHRRDCQAAWCRATADLEAAFQLEMRARETLRAERQGLQRVC